MKIPAFDDREMKTIVGKIDLFYAALLSTQEQYLNVQSNSQVIRLRIDLKEGAIERKKILLLSKGNPVSHNFILLSMLSQPKFKNITFKKTNNLFSVSSN